MRIMDDGWKGFSSGIILASMNRNEEGWTSVSARIPSPPPGVVRVGYTVSKRVDKRAVVRNKIRRRLKHIVRNLLPVIGKSGHDYVLTARESAATRTFAELTRDVEKTFERLAPVSPEAKAEWEKNRKGKGKKKKKK